MTKVVAANWKMHHGPRAAEAFLHRFRPPSAPGVRILLFPPHLSLACARARAPEGVGIGVQNIHWQESGALTGEISAAMAHEAGATHVLIGHSERRHLFGESDADVKRKVRAAIQTGLIPVVCVGELLEERRAGKLSEVLRRQVGAFRDALAGAGEWMVAYEPVWAIGTGETATPADATEAHAIVRTALKDRSDCPILYGGSVKPANAQALMNAPEVDGVLVGGASLDPAIFAEIAAAALPSSSSP